MKVDIIKICDMLQGAFKTGKLKSAEDASLIRGAIEAHFDGPRKAAKKHREIMASQTGSGVSSNFAEVSSQAFTVFNQMPEWDNFYEEAFREVPVENGKWEIHDTSNGVTIQKVPEGHRLKVRSLESEVATVRTAKYGGALQWTDEMIRHRQIARMMDMMEALRNGYWDYKADQHYGLLTAAAPASGANSNVTAYDTTAGNTQLTKDIDTIDSANYTLVNRNREKGYNMGTPILYLPESMRKRMSTAFRVSELVAPVSDSQGSGTVLNNLVRPVRPIFTWNSQIPANTGILVLPGNKIQRADEVSPFMLTDEDILSLQYVLAIWSYYGAAVGDVQQIQRVLFA